MAEDASEIPAAAGPVTAPPRRRILSFLGATLAWGVVFFGLWHAASTPISATAGWFAARTMEALGPVDSAHASLVDGRVVVEVQPDASVRYSNRVPGGMLFSLSVNARKYTVALPFFFALIAAARPRRAIRVIGGAMVLLVLAGAGIACEAAIGFASTATPAGAPLFRPGTAIGTVLALGYQLGTLLLPTLAPIALWFWAGAGKEVARAARAGGDAPA